MPKRNSILPFRLVVVASGMAQALAADLMIDVGQHTLLPNAPGQRIEIRVSGAIEVAGVNFKAQVTDGFPEVPDSTVDGPNITDVDLVGSLSPTIFTLNHAGQQDPGSVPQVALRTTTTQSGLVVADGLLATLTIDTTGFTEGTFALRLGDTYAGPTEFLDAEAGIVPTLIKDGTIIIANEVPPSITLVVTGEDLRLEWSSATLHLEEAGAVIGPWRQVDGDPPSPYLVKPTAAMRFYRLR